MRASTGPSPAMHGGVPGCQGLKRRRQNSAVSTVVSPLQLTFMSLESTISDVTGRLRQGRFPNKQSISQGIALRILQELGWVTQDTVIVWPEFQTGEGRANFALCHTATKPAVFIKVKAPDRAKSRFHRFLCRRCKRDSGSNLRRSAFTIKQALICGLILAVF
jgi:hypothetical protein